MQIKFKTKEISKKKRSDYTRHQYHMRHLKQKNNKEADDSASYKSYANDEIINNAEKSYKGAKSLAIKSIRNIRPKKENIIQADNRTGQTRSSILKNSLSIGPKSKVEKTKHSAFIYQNKAKSMVMRNAQKSQVLSQIKSQSISFSKTFEKWTAVLTKMIPLKWKQYIALIGGGIIVIFGFFIIMIGSIFSGENGSTYNGAFAMPFDNAESVSITDDYGWRIHPITGELSFHYGIDFGTPWHCEIKAIAIGEVTYADVYGTYGNTVIIKHEIFGDVIYSMYAHLSEIKVETSQMILQGEVIGLEGGDPTIDPNSGASTGHHLHFGIMGKDMSFVNPADFLMLK